MSEVNFEGAAYRGYTRETTWGGFQLKIQMAEWSSGTHVRVGCFMVIPRVNYPV